MLMCLGLLMAGTLFCSAQEQNKTSLGTIDLTLEKAIEIALAENPTIHVVDRDIELKKVADKEAWQALLPTADVNLSLTDNVKVAKMKTSMGEFKMGIDGTVSTVGGLTVNLPLFAPAVYQNMKLTKQDILLAQEKARGSRLPHQSGDESILQCVALQRQLRCDEAQL